MPDQVKTPDLGRAQDNLQRRSERWILRGAPSDVSNGNRGHVNHLARAGSGSCCGRKKRAVSQQVMAAARKISNSSPSPDFAEQARIADQMSKQQHEVQQAEG